MANRVLRDWTQSESIDKLSQGAEIFFTRLIMKADDFGCYYGNPKLLNSALFPLKDYDQMAVVKWRDECAKANIIILYEVEGKKYVKIVDFGQRLRIMKSKFPQPVDQPTADCGQMTAECQPETKRNEEESEVENETETEVAEATAIVWPLFDDFWEKYGKKVGKPKCIALWEKISQGAREKIMQHLEVYTLKEKQYRKDPERYLKHKTWEDEVILTAQHNGKGINNKQQHTDSLKDSIRNTYGNLGAK